MELLERSLLLERLAAGLERARGGAGSLVLVGGEAGAGKTSLVQRFVEDCPPPVRVLWGACDPLSTPRPLAPFRDMSELEPLLGRGLGRHALLAELLEELQLHTVTVIEDAHWADEATLDALRFLGRRIARSRSLLVVTYRDDELGVDHPLRAVLGDLATTTGSERLHVPPLSVEGVRILAEGLALDPERLHRITGGNAFYVSEVLAAPGWTVPVSVADAVLARVSRLSPSARALVDLVSLGPGGLEVEVAERLTGDAGEALDEAVERGVLVASGARIRFRHELARLALVDAIPSGRRRRLELSVLDELEQRGADSARLAHHADAAGAAERVLRYAPEAAREASARGAHREAARQYERALGYADELPTAELADLLMLWTEERVGFDQPPNRIRLLERIIELRRQCGDTRGLGQALTALSLTVWGTGRNADAAALVDEAIRTLEPLSPGPELAHAHAARSIQEALARHGHETLESGARAIELAERFDAPVALHLALCAVGGARLACFGDAAGIADLERSARLGLENGDDFAVGRALGNLGNTLGELRRYGQAIAYLEQAIAFDDEHDLDGQGGYARSWLAKVRFEQGGWDEAEQHAEQALVHRDVLVLIPITALCVKGRLRVRRGDPDGDAFLDEAWALAERTGELRRLWPIAAGRAESAWLNGRADRIEELVRPTYEHARTLGLEWAVGELGFWLWRAGADMELLDGGAEPYALQARGEWARAAAAWRRIGCPYEVADALADGDEAAMRESLAILTELGAEPAADRVRVAMRRAGVKNVPARPRASTVAAPARLTRRQLEVLALVESGLSNAEIASRLFISEKTAGHHVSAILQKLGAASRGEAASVARKLGIVSARR